jgi:hypothetical protein
MIGVHTARSVPARGATARGHAMLLRARVHERAGWAGPGPSREGSRPAADAVVTYGDPVPAISVEAGGQAGGAVRTAVSGLLGGGEPVPTGCAPGGVKDLSKPAKPTGREDTVWPCRRTRCGPREDGTR